VRLAHFAGRFRASGAPGKRLQSGEICTFNDTGERLQMHDNMPGHKKITAPKKKTGCCLLAAKENPTRLEKISVAKMRSP